MNIFVAICLVIAAAGIGFIAGRRCLLSQKPAPMAAQPPAATPPSGTTDLLSLSEDTAFAAQQLVWGMNDYKKSLQHLTELSANISSDTETNAAGLEEMTASVQEIAASAGRVLSEAQTSASSCHATSELAMRHQSSISSMAAMMNDVTAVMDKAVNDIRLLNESSDQIAGFVIKIRNIASQTNLLALNAAIEAARAGENGRGFAVVAEEIRKLAVESEASTQEIETIVKNITGNTANVTANMESGNSSIRHAEAQAQAAAAAMSDFIGDITAIANSIDALCSLSTTQSNTTEAVARAIENISRATLHIAASAHESSSQFQLQEKSLNELLGHLENVRAASEKLQTVAAQTKKPDELIFAINPFIAPEMIKKNYVPILNTAAAKIGCKARVIIVSDYDALGSVMAAGQADIGWFSPFAYVSAHNKTDLTPLATPKVNNSTSYEGYIITRKDSGLSSIDSLQGRRFGFVDKKSASGYVYPKALLASHGKAPDSFFGETQFLGSHSQVIEAVMDGTIDAGATYSDAFAGAAKSGLNTSELQIIARTEPIPKDVIAARSSLDSDKLQSLTEALTQLQDTNPEYSFMKQANINGFVTTADENYDVVRRAANI